MKFITKTIDAVTKLYGDKVSAAELRVLFVNYLKKQKSSKVFNIILERRRWRPTYDTNRCPGTDACANESPVVQTGRTFTWKGWRRKIESEIKTRSVVWDEW